MKLLLTIVFSVIVWFVLSKYYFWYQQKIFLDNVKRSLNLCEKWLINNIKENWVFLYLYNPTNKQISTKNNVLRQLMASRYLAYISNHKRWLQQLHKKNLEFIFKYRYKEQWQLWYIYYNNKSKLGAIAMAVRTMVASPFFEQYKSQTKKLVNTILYLQNKDWSFRAWFKAPEYFYDEKYLLTFYSWEAILALVEYYQKTKDKTILQYATKAQDFYIKEYVDNLEKNYYPAYVPWHTISMAKLYTITKNKDYIKNIFILNDKLLEIQNQDYSNLNYLWRFYNPSFPQYGTPHSSSDAIYTEWLAYAYFVAKQIQDKQHMFKYKKAIMLGAWNLIRLQYQSWWNILEWAVRVNYNDFKIRVDTTQHTADAFDAILSFLN